MCFNQTGDIFTLNGSSLKLVDKFTYLGSSVSSNETDIDTRLSKAWTAIIRLSVIWKSDLTDKMKRSFFQAAVVIILLYGCTTWTLTKRVEKKLDGNYTRMLWAIFNIPGGNTPQNSRYTATYHSSRKLSKSDEPDMRDTAEEVGMTYKWCTHVDPFTWTSEGRATTSNLHTAALCRYEVYPWRPAGSNERYWRVAREGQGYPCWWHDKMMMMNIHHNFCRPRKRGLPLHC